MSGQIVPLHMSVLHIATDPARYMKARRRMVASAEDCLKQSENDRAAARAMLLNRCYNSARSGKNAPLRQAALIMAVWNAESDATQAQIAEQVIQSKPLNVAIIPRDVDEQLQAIRERYTMRQIY